MSNDAMMDRIIAAITDKSGGAEGQRSRFQVLWDEIGADGDPLHRCTLAHYAADVETDPRQSLLWNRRSLDAAMLLSDARLKTTFPTLTVAGFRPSLHLNLAQDYFELGALEDATRELDAAEEDMTALSDDGYGAMVRLGIDRLREKVAASSDRR
jgi:hypothetical protein